jgi:hypothetical protein
MALIVVHVVHVDVVRLSLNCGHQWAYFFIPQVIYKHGELQGKTSDPSTRALWKLF